MVDEFLISLHRYKCEPVLNSAVFDIPFFKISLVLTNVKLKTDRLIFVFCFFKMIMSLKKSGRERTTHLLRPAYV